MTHSIDRSRPRQAHAGRGRFVFLLGLALASPAFLAACDTKPAGSPPKAGHAAGPTHTVRGRVVSLPIPNDPSASFSVFHETIAEWLRPDGTKGMNAMVMPFPLAAGVTLEGIAAGDVVELVVRQQPGDAIPYVTTKITKLPAETVLTLPERNKK